MVQASNKKMNKMMGCLTCPHIDPPIGILFKQNEKIYDVLYSHISTMYLYLYDELYSCAYYAQHIVTLLWVYMERSN